MTLQEALHLLKTRFENAGIPEARLDAEYLVAAAAEIPRLRLALKLKTSLRAAQEAMLKRWMEGRLERKPLAYILEQQPFMHLSLHVTPAVLIPRPETELLVEEALRLLDSQSSAIVVDVGTGSGAIALSLVTHKHVAQVHAIDISESALQIAQENALRHSLQDRVAWHWGDLLSPIKNKGLKVDLIVANLPYIRTSEIIGLSPEVRWEPSLALDGGKNGLEYIAPLVKQAETVLKQEGYLLLEIGADQGSDVLKLFAKPAWKNVQLYNDLAGLPRIVKATAAGRRLKINKGDFVGSTHY